MIEPVPGERPEHFDAVVVGSGFGGSIMAYRLAQSGQRVCLLERGRRYPPGSFARSPGEMAGNFWDPSAGRHGLFQVWKFRHFDAVVAAGLGGGSLIYANVLIRKDERWFARRSVDGGLEEWPVTRDDLDEHYERVERMLGATPYPFDQPPYCDTPKTAAFRDAARRAGVEWFLPNLAVTFADHGRRPVPGEPIHSPTGATTDNLHGRTRYTCRLCGECDVGCNFGSKNTLDFNYLTAASRLGVQIRDLCEAKTISPGVSGGYTVEYVRHPSETDDRGRPRGDDRVVRVESDRLVLAAGALGTTELLLRNRHRFAHLSKRIGHCFSGNGDFLGFARSGRRRRSAPPVLEPSRGTVVTSAIRCGDDRDGGAGPGLYIQEGGYPVIASWLAEATDIFGVSSRLLRLFGDQVLARLSSHRRPDLGSRLGGILGDTPRSVSLLPLLAMGMDEPNGQVSLRRGGLQNSWLPDLTGAYYRRASDTSRLLAEAMGAEFTLAPNTRIGRVVTVHPLGGCPMGRDPGDGVVDSRGQVFGYPGLVVADGSVVPGPVGPNPALTIAALSDRFADHLI